MPPTAYYKLGRADAHNNRYPLYSALVCAERYMEARDYSEGWYGVNGCDLGRWVDPRSAAE